MESSLAEIEKAFAQYGQDLENYEKKRKPTDGLFGLGHVLQHDACHDRLDERIEQAVQRLCASGPDAQTAEACVRLLLRENTAGLPQAAQWMLRAIERHSLPLIPFLDSGAAASLSREYAARYKPWDRLPAQKEVLRALKKRAGE